MGRASLNHPQAESVRARIGAAIFERVAGPEGPARRQLIQAAGERPGS